MKIRKLVLAVGAIAAVVAISTVAYAVEEFNTSRSNVSSEIERDPIDVVVSFEFSMSIDSGNDKLSYAEYMKLVDSSLASVRTDMMAQYDGDNLPDRRTE